MAEPTVGGLERQVREHGYTIKTTVERDGKAVVSLSRGSTNYQSAAEFKADSGRDVGATRYTTALTIAVTRMLDFEYRGGGNNRPRLGESHI